MRRSRRSTLGGSSRVVRRAIRRQRRRIVRRTLLVGGMVVIAAQGKSAAIKLSQQDAQRIQEHTGKPPQELEDQDLAQALQELSIQPQPLTPEEQAALDQTGAAPTQPEEPAQPPRAVDAEPDVITQIERFADLRDRGILTEEEFEAKKRLLLGI